MNGNINEAVIRRILKKLAGHGVYAEAFAEDTERLVAVLKTENRTGLKTPSNRVWLSGSSTMAKPFSASPQR